MSQASPWQKRWLLPGLLLVLTVMVALSTLSTQMPAGNEPLANRSIYNNGPSGYRAWWLACQKSGLGFVSWEKPFEKLGTLPESATMLVVEPFTFSASEVLFGEEEAEATLDWVRRGNTLVLLDDFHRFGSYYVAQQVGLRVKATKPQTISPQALPEKRRNGETTQLSQVMPIQVLRGQQAELGNFVVQPVVSRRFMAFQPHGKADFSSSWQPILVDRDGAPLLIRMPLGKGTLILGTVADLGENGYLRDDLARNDNYQFLANLLRRESKLVFVNEYVHAYQEPGNLMTYLGQKTPLGVIFVQLVLGFVLLLWLSATRWTPKPEQNGQVGVTDEVDSLQAYIQSMARIYMRSRAASLALEPQLNRIEILLRQRHRLTLDDESRLRHLLGTSPGDYSNREDSPELRPESLPESLVDALQQARLVVRTQGRLTSRDLLRLARQLTLIEERLQYERHRTHVPAR
jgi:hypothetical protein